MIYGDNSMTTILKRFAAAAVIGVLAHPCLAADAVSIRSLLREMIDRDRLPQLPSPAFRAGQASS